MIKRTEYGIERWAGKMLESIVRFIRTVQKHLFTAKKRLNIIDPKRANPAFDVFESKFYNKNGKDMDLKYSRKIKSHTKYGFLPIGDTPIHFTLQNTVYVVIYRVLKLLSPSMEERVIQI